MSRAIFKLLHASHVAALIGVLALGAWGLAATVTAFGSEAAHHAIPRAAALSALVFVAAFLPSARRAHFSGFVLPAFVATTIVSVAVVVSFVSGLTKGFPTSASPGWSHFVAYSALFCTGLGAAAIAWHFWRSSLRDQA